MRITGSPVTRGCSPAFGARECAQFIADRKLPLERIFSHQYTSLEQADEAYRLFDTQTTGKAVIHP